MNNDLTLDKSINNEGYTLEELVEAREEFIKDVYKNDPIDTSKLQSYDEDIRKMVTVKETVLLDNMVDALTFLIFTNNVTREDIVVISTTSFKPDLLGIVENMQLVMKDEGSIDKEETIDILYTCEVFQKGYIEKVFALYEQNPMIKHREELDVYDKKVSSMGLNELEDEFIDLIKNKTSPGMTELLVKLTVFVHNETLNNLSEEERKAEIETYNINATKFSGLLGVMSDKFGCKEDATKLYKTISGIINTKY